MANSEKICLKKKPLSNIVISIVVLYARMLAKYMFIVIYISNIN